MSKVRVEIQIDEGLWAQAGERARRAGRSREQLVESALREFLSDESIEHVLPQVEARSAFVAEQNSAVAQAQAEAQRIAREAHWASTGNDRQ